MATDLDQIVRDITGFYDLADKTVVAVGAGGGQLIEYARPARGVIAVDPDGEALARLAARAAERGLAGRIELVHGDLLTVDPRGDAVLFEFCLHEMPDPERALDHASTLAPDVLIVDHAPGSPWMGHAGEEAGVAVCWAAVARRAVRRRLDVEAVQRFEDYAELEARMARQGPTSRERIDALRSRRPIALSMPYRLVLL